MRASAVVLGLVLLAVLASGVEAQSSRHSARRAAPARPRPSPAAPHAPAAPVVPDAIQTLYPGKDLNALLEPEGNGTAFHKDAVDDRIAQAIRLQPRIDAWAEGSVLSLENGKLSLYGHPLPYATLYARMMKDIDRRTDGMQGDALKERVRAMQKEWQQKHFATKDLETGDDAEMKFALARSGRLAVMDDAAEVVARLSGPVHLPVASSVVTGAPVQTKGATNTKAEDADEPVNDSALMQKAAEAASIVSSTSASDDDGETLHVGDKIRVGYDATQSPPMAFVAFRIAKPSSVISVEQ